jgi:hypothetical protein
VVPVVVGLANRGRRRGRGRSTGRRRNHLPVLVIAVGLLVGKAIEDDGMITRTRVDVAKSPGSDYLRRRRPNTPTRFSNADTPIRRHADPFRHGVIAYTIGRPIELGIWGVKSQCRITREAPVRTEHHPTYADFAPTRQHVSRTPTRRYADTPTRSAMPQCKITREAPARTEHHPTYADGAPTRRYANTPTRRHVSPYADTPTRFSTRRPVPPTPSAGAG